jgi:SAM-dependent methyltransferase
MRGDEDRPEDWDRRYSSQAQWWSGRPNGALVAEVEALDPGTALDVGSGEGADAVWLAARGWTVTAIDISQVALDRARQAAEQAGVEVDWVRADVAVEPPAPGRYDLVSVQYPALRHSADDAAIKAILHAVAPGGRLLLVHHSFADAGHQPHGFDPADYLQPADLVGHLDAAWTIEVYETRPRAPGHHGPAVADVVLRARRA